MKYRENGLPKNWDGKDWDTYKRAMTNFFAEQDLLDTVEKKESDTKKENKVRMYIDMSVPPSAAAQLREANTGSDMWETLCEVYETKKDAVLRAHKIRRLRSELENMSFRLGGDMNLHLAQTFNKKRELEQLEFKVHDIEMIDLMLKSLPHHSVFLSFKYVLKFGSDLANLDPTDVCHRMMLAAQEVAEIQAQDGRGQATGGKSKAKGDAKGAKDDPSALEGSLPPLYKHVGSMVEYKRASGNRSPLVLSRTYSAQIIPAVHRERSDRSSCFEGSANWSHPSARTQLDNGRPRDPVNKLLQVPAASTASDYPSRYGLATAFAVVSDSHLRLRSSAQEPPRSANRDSHVARGVAYLCGMDTATERTKQGLATRTWLVGHGSNNYKILMLANDEYFILQELGPQDATM
ncbi:hypothetical protein PsorP6_010787 [Peronosclerospora sorghi]|uniref:Uncharacterized protein n=1 Tax=Peronosclerospora sorghi TaxID=230839 RepID=A0ACC0VW54_9STRA|nr:hypothetical protein PsorP6_010787 [Peronosclerospora sorghi]